jgi:hypothetical protein
MSLFLPRVIFFDLILRYVQHCYAWWLSDRHHIDHSSHSHYRDWSSECRLHHCQLWRRQPWLISFVRDYRDYWSLLFTSSLCHRLRTCIYTSGSVQLGTINITAALWRDTILQMDYNSLGFEFGLCAYPFLLSGRNLLSSALNICNECNKHIREMIYNKENPSVPRVHLPFHSSQTITLAQFLS